MALRKVTVSWDLVSPALKFPAGTVGGDYEVSITGGQLAAPLVELAAASPAVFASVPEEKQTDPDYTATVRRLDVNGVQIGDSVSLDFSVLEPADQDVAVDTPMGVTVAVE